MLAYLDWHEMGSGWRENWGNDGYAVEDASAAAGGSSVYNDLRLAIGAELDRTAGDGGDASVADREGIAGTTVPLKLASLKTDDADLGMGSATADEFTFGDAASLQLQFDSSNSLVQITAGGRTYLSSQTPTWAITATDCNSVFPAFGAGPVSSQFYSPIVARTHRTEAYPGGSRLVLGWGNVAVNNATISVEVRIDIKDDAPQEAVWTGSVASPAGCCVQTFSLVDLRTLHWNATAGDRLFLPLFQGVVTDCAAIIKSGDVTICGAAHPELNGISLQRSEHQWVPNGGARAMGWMALLKAASEEAPAQALCKC